MTEDERPRPDLEWAIVVPARSEGPQTQPDLRWLNPAPERRPSRALVVVSIVAVAMSAVAAVTVSRAVQARVDAASGAQIARGTAMGTSGSSYSFTWVNPDGSPVRWDPCSPIDWVSNTSRAPAGALADFQAALGRISALTGLEFAYGGDVDEVPSGDRAPVQQRYGGGWAPVLVSWAPIVGTALGTSLGTSADTVGVATPVAISRPGSPGVIVTAQIVFESGRPLPAGFANSGARGAVMLHEVAHALGLAHVDDPSQLMFDGDHGGVSAGELGHGDAAGLERLGVSAGCLDEPSPGDIG